MKLTLEHEAMEIQKKETEKRDKKENNKVRGKLGEVSKEEG